MRLSDYWGDGMRTKHGMHAHGFPNMFIWAAHPGRQPHLQHPTSAMAYFQNIDQWRTKRNFKGLAFR